MTSESIDQAQLRKAKQIVGEIIGKKALKYLEPSDEFCPDSFIFPFMVFGFYIGIGDKCLYMPMSKARGHSEFGKLPIFDNQSWDWNSKYVAESVSRSPRWINLARIEACVRKLTPFWKRFWMAKPALTESGHIVWNDLKWRLQDGQLECHLTGLNWYLVESYADITGAKTIRSRNRIREL